MMNNRFKNYGVWLILLCVGVGLSGCSRKLYEEGTITKNRIQVEEKKFSEQMPAVDFDKEFAGNLGHYYRHNGQGAVDLSVLYDPSSRTNTAMWASQEASRIAALMRENGISDIQTNILPIKSLGPQARVMLNFTTYSASAPKDCGTMPGFANRDIGRDDEYSLGCTVETVFARQVARPKDLMGNDNAGNTTDGRRASNIGEIYRSGAPNQPLEGQSASGN